MSRREHWDEVYETKPTDGVSWYRPHLETSLEWIEALELSNDARIVDVGGGASTLVDDLLERGHRNLAVLDISERALEAARKRLGDSAEDVDWVVGDVTDPHFDSESVDVWHDRAVFHFLTDEQSRRDYARELVRSLAPGGHAIIATFGIRGPDRCSGLEVVRYSADELAATIGSRELRLVESTEKVHVTPWGAEQAFVHTLFRREG